MTNSMKRIACVLLMAAALAATIAHGGDVQAISDDVPSEGAYEKCLALTVGQTIEIAFEADSELDFNLHYHADGKTIYPIKKRGVESYEWSFVAEHTRKHCLMWSNAEYGEVGIKIEYRLSN